MSKTQQNSQSGMVAILVTMILMIVISLIVLGFAQISRRNERQAVDRQLSTQAFYAAETGVNDVANLIKAAVSTGTSVAAKPDCTSNVAFYSTLSPVLDASNKVQYTCLMVDPTPTSLVYNSVSSTGTVVPLIATSGTIASMTLNWQTKDDTTAPATSCPASKVNAFSPTASWNCGYGVLRFDLVPTAGSLTVAGLQGSVMTVFVVPLRPGSVGGDSSTIAYAGGSGSSLKGIVCSQTGCSVTVNGLTQSQYYLRVTSVYKEVSLQVATANGAGSAVALQGAQAVVDATGKAQDVLRRIQVRIPLSGSSTNHLSDYAIQSTNALCKRFSIMNNFYQNDANNAVSGVSAGNSSGLMCQ